jgi:hypothetical protein
MDIKSSYTKNPDQKKAADDDDRFALEQAPAGVDGPRFKIPASLIRRKRKSDKRSKESDCKAALQHIH